MPLYLHDSSETDHVSSCDCMTASCNDQAEVVIVVLQRPTWCLSLRARVVLVLSEAMSRCSLQHYDPTFLTGQCYGPSGCMDHYAVCPLFSLSAMEENGGFTDGRQF